MKTEIYYNHLLIHAINHYGKSEIHVYRPDGLRIIDTAKTIEQAKQFINEDLSFRDNNR